VPPISAACKYVLVCDRFGWPSIACT
jgi:hypothetical protein